MKNIIYIFLFFILLQTTPITTQAKSLEAIPYTNTFDEQTSFPKIIKTSLSSVIASNVFQDDSMKTAKSIYDTSIILSTILIGFCTLYYIYVRYSKEHYILFNEEYYSDLPTDYSPAEVGYLMNMEKTNSNDMIATLLDMVRRKYLKLENIEDKEKDFKIVDLRFHLTERNDYDNLKRHERFLIEWLIFEVGNGAYFDTSFIKETDYADKKSLVFARKYQEWCGYVEIDSMNRHFFEDNTQGFVFSLVTGIVFFIIAFIGIIGYNLKSFSSFLILGIVVIIYGHTIKRKTEKGQEDYQKWLGLKNYIRDFSSMNDYSINALEIWEHYLIYAIPLGVAKEFIKNIPKVFAKYEFDTKRSRIFTLFGGHVATLDNLSLMFGKGLSDFSDRINYQIEREQHVKSLVPNDEDKKDIINIKK